jgi:hypothetical protein
VQRASCSPATRRGASPPTSPSCRSCCAGGRRKARRDEIAAAPLTTVPRNVRLDPKFGRKPKLTKHQQQEALARREGGEALTEIGRATTSATQRSADWGCDFNAIGHDKLYAGNKVLSR